LRPLDRPHGPDRLDLLALELKTAPCFLDPGHQRLVDDVHGSLQLAVSANEQPRHLHRSCPPMFRHPGRVQPTCHPSSALAPYVQCGSLLFVEPANFRCGRRLAVAPPGRSAETRFPKSCFTTREIGEVSNLSTGAGRQLRFRLGGHRTGRALDAPRARLEASEHEANLAGRSDAGGANQRGALALVRAQHLGRVEIAPVLEPFTELFDLLALKARDLAPLERIHEAPRVAAEAHGELGDGLDEPVRYGPRRFERMPVDRLAAALHVGVDPRARDAAARVETLA